MTPAANGWPNQRRSHAWELSQSLVVCLSCGRTVELDDPQRATLMQEPCPSGASGIATETTLLSQLVQLNERSRWYSQQGWQVPFAYLGVTALIANAISGTARAELVIGASAVAALGTAVWIHATYMRRRAHRAVALLRDVESQLGITGHAIPGAWHYWILNLTIVVTATSSAVYAALLVLN
jgi:hypothetical protein